MTFEEYLAKKKIDALSFQAAQPDRFADWKRLFEQMSEASFTSQKLYLVNPLRRQFPAKEVPPTPSSQEGDGKPKVSRPILKPKTS